MVIHLRGGNLVTIRGRGLPRIPSQATVALDGVLCVVRSSSVYVLTCEAGNGTLRAAGGAKDTNE